MQSLASIALLGALSVVSAGWESKTGKFIIDVIFLTNYIFCYQVHVTLVNSLVVTPTRKYKSQLVKNQVFYTLVIFLIKLLFNVFKFQFLLLLLLKVSYYLYFLLLIITVNLQMNVRTPQPVVKMSKKVDWSVSTVLLSLSSKIKYLNLFLGLLIDT